MIGLLLYISSSSYAALPHRLKGLLLESNPHCEKIIVLTIYLKALFDSTAASRASNDDDLSPTK